MSVIPKRIDGVERAVFAIRRRSIRHVPAMTVLSWQIFATRMAAALCSVACFRVQRQ